VELLKLYLLIFVGLDYLSLNRLYPNVMKTSRFLFLVLLALSCCISGRAFQRSIQNRVSQSSVEAKPKSDQDELAVHRSAADTYQLSGDLEHARVENRFTVSLALRRLANIEIREGQPKRSAELLTESIASNDSAQTRSDLAFVNMQLGDVDEGIKNARIAVNLDKNNGEAQEALSKLCYLKGDYAGALPGLERILQLKPDFDDAFLLGMTYLHLQELERAKLLFEEIENVISKKNAPLYLMFARAFEETDYPREAEIQYKKAIELDPKAPKSHFYYGYFLLQNGGSGRTLDAEKEFQRELVITPGDSYSYFFLGVIASSQNDHPKAIEYLKKAILINGKIGQAYLFLGQSQLELGETAAAEQSLRRSIELDTDSAKSDFQVRRAYFLLGRLLAKAGRKSESDAAFAKARELQGRVYEQARDDIKKVYGEVVNSRDGKPEAGLATKIKTPVITPQKAAEYSKIKAALADILGQAYNNLGVISVQQGNLTESVENFTAASKWDSNLPGLDRNCGIVNFRLSQFDKAIFPLSRVVKADPKDILVRQMLGISYYFNKNYKLAAETLKPLGPGIAGNAELAYFYGISLVQLQRQQEAATIFASIVTQNEKSAQAHFYAGQGFVLTEDYERAVKEFRNAAVLDPQMIQAHYNAGQSLIRLNQLAEAEKEFRLELQINPSDESSKYHLAYSLLERKIGVDEALSLLKEAIATRYDYADARYQLGKVMIEKGDLSGAIYQLETAANIEPKKEYIHYQLSIAYRRASRIADADRELKLYSELKAENRKESPAGMRNKKDGP
jgi:tetratricopeptide (TPR) repeat protein